MTGQTHKSEELVRGQPSAEKSKEKVDHKVRPEFGSWLLDECLKMNLFIQIDLTLKTFQNATSVRP